MACYFKGCIICKFFIFNSKWYCVPSFIRPWVLGQVGSPPAATAVTFASIVEEEKQQEAALIRSREKPLALIQVTVDVSEGTAVCDARKLQ